MKVTVFGMGYVGCVTAAVLAREGHQVTGVDTNPTKVDALGRGESPVLEPGLPDLVRHAHRTGRLTATSSAAHALARAEIVFVCVGTPSTASGAIDSGAVERVAAEIGAGVAGRVDYPVVVLRSTVLPNVVEEAIVPALERAAGSRLGEALGFALNPEFLREGTAIHDFDNPQFTLIGTAEPRTAAIMERLYAFLKAETVVTDRPTAALVKYACNSFHALKVSFANEIGAISGAAGVDGREVMQLLCLDHKLNLSAAYLKPGMPFGGSCLPKDVRAIVHYGRRSDLALPLLGSVLESNRLQIEACVSRILAHGRPRVGVFGMSFKAGTDDLRESPTVAIIEALLGKGIKVAIFDGRVAVAQLVGANREYVAEHLPHVGGLLRASIDEVLADSDVLVIGNGDPSFQQLPELMRPGQVLIDLVGIPRSDALPGEQRRRAGS